MPSKKLEIIYYSILKKSMEFSTTSGAACFVLGGNQNGWVEWKNADGKTLDEMYRKN